MANKHSGRRKLTSVLIAVFLTLGFSSGYGFEASSGKYLVRMLTVSSGALAIAGSSGNNNYFTLGEGFVSLSISSSRQFSVLAGELWMLSLWPAERAIKWISALAARSDIAGEVIHEKTWQADDSPYFYWGIDLKPASLLKGFSVSWDLIPQKKVMTEATAYQLPDGALSSGKHVFYVLPCTTAGVWNNDSLLSFEIWVDTAIPVVGQVTPVPATVLSEKKPEISCYVYDSDSGLNLARTTLELNGRQVPYRYEPAGRVLSFNPAEALPEGRNILMLKAQDYVFNSANKGWEFIVDSLPPEGSIKINGAQPTSLSAYVNLELEARDVTSGVRSVYLSNDGVFDTEMLSPYAYSPFVRGWLLASADISGNKTVYARFEDYAGNLSAIYSASIKLNSQSLDTRITSGPGAENALSTACFNFESTNPKAKFSWRLDSAGWSDWSDQPKACFSGLSKGNHFFYVKSGMDSNADQEISAFEEDVTPASWLWAVEPDGASVTRGSRILYWRR